MKNSIYPFGVLAFGKLIAWFPGMIGQLLMWYTVSKTTLIFSNLPGPRTPLQFNGIKSKGLIALVPGLGDLAFGITAVSMGDTVYLSVQSDRS